MSTADHEQARSAAPPVGVAETLAALLLLCVSLILYVPLVAAVPLSGTWLLDLDPRPDGEEYLASALAMADEGTFAIHIAGHRAVSRYPPGYSALMVPLLWAGVTPILVPFLVNRIVGFTMIGGLFAWLWRCARPAAAGLGALLLVTFPAFVILCRSPMSEVSASAILLAGLACLYEYGRRGRLAVGTLGGWLLGISACVRIANIFFAPALLFAALAAARARPARLKAACALSAAALVGITPLLAFNWHYLGHPFQFGYAQWVPGKGTPAQAFGFEYLTTNLRLLWNELMQRENGYNTANLFDSGSYFGPALVVLASLTALRGLSTATSRIVSVAAVVYAGVMLFYFFEDPRFMFPALLIAVPAGAMLTADAIGRAVARPAPRTLGAAAVIGLLVAAAVIGVPGRQRYSDLRGLFEFRPSSTPPRAYAAIEELNRITHGGEWLALTDIHPPFVYALTKGARVVVPLVPADLPRGVAFTEQDRASAIRTALASGRVYAVIVDHAVDDIDRLCPPPAGYQWRTIVARDPRMGIMEVTPRAASVTTTASK